MPPRSDGKGGKTVEDKALAAQKVKCKRYFKSKEAGTSTSDPPAGYDEWLQAYKPRTNKLGEKSSAATPSTMASSATPRETVRPPSHNPLVRPPQEPILDLIENQRPVETIDTAAIDKRQRGHPPSAKPPTLPAPPSTIPAVAGPSSIVNRKARRPPSAKPSTFSPPPGTQPGPSSSAGNTKRGRGRPPSAKPSTLSPPPGTQAGPSSSVGINKGKPGRPPSAKPSTLSTPPTTQQGPSSSAGVTKCGPENPPSTTPSCLPTISNKNLVARPKPAGSSRNRLIRDSDSGRGFYDNGERQQHSRGREARLERARAGKKLATSDREREVDSNGDSASEVDSDGRDAERGHQKEHRLPQEPKTRRREKRQEADEEGSATRDPIHTTDDDDSSDEFLPLARKDRYVDIDDNSRLDVEEPLPPLTQQARIGRGVNDDDSSDEFLPLARNDRYVDIDDNSRLDVEEPLPPLTQQARIGRGVNDDDDSRRDDENLRSQFNNTTVYGDEDPNLDGESQASSGEHSNLDADRDFSVPLFNAVDHFFQHLTKGIFCDVEEHEKVFQKHHWRLQKQDDSHSNCENLEFLGQKTDPRYNTHIPDFLDKKYFYRGATLMTTPAHPVKKCPNLTDIVRRAGAAEWRDLFEGTAHPTQRSPPRICMHHEEYTARQPAPVIKIDIDSVCGYGENLAMFKRGWTFYPHTSNGNVIRGRIHGIHIQIEDPSSPLGYSMVSPQEIPHLQGGCLPTWKPVDIFFLFPQMWLKRKGTSEPTVFLTMQQRREFYDLAFYPALEAVLDASDLYPFPRNFDIAIANSQVSSKERGRANESEARVQLMGNSVSPDISSALTTALHHFIDKNGLSLFRNMIVFFDGKGLKEAHKANTYVNLNASWYRHWNREIDETFCPKKQYWIDLGRQFGPGPVEDLGHTLLWKSCCLKKYWNARAKRFGHETSLPLLQYQFAGIRDVISTSMTAQAGSPQSLAGAPHSAFYSKSKTFFVSSAFQVFENPNIDVLVHGERHLEAIANEGKASVPKLQQGATNFLHGKIRANENINKSSETDCEAREEHRLRGDLFYDLMEKLRAHERRAIDVHDMTLYQHKLAFDMQRNVQQFADGDADFISRTCPFYIVTSASFGSFLRGSLNKALMGFEMVLSQIHGNSVSQELTATGLLFLSAVRYSILSKRVSFAPELFKDKWRYILPKRRNNAGDVFESPDEDSSNHDVELEFCEGLAMKNAAKEYGYVWIGAKINFSIWQLYPEHARNFFRQEPAFATAMKKRRNQVIRVDEAMVTVKIIQDWMEDLWSNHRVPPQPAAVDLILDFCSGFIMILYRSAIWQQLFNNKVLSHNTKAIQEQLIAGNIAVSYANIVAFVQDKNPKARGKLNFATSNRAFHKGDAKNVFDYLFKPGKLYDSPTGVIMKREHWEKKSFRMTYTSVYDLLSEYLSPERVASWNECLFLVMHATNPLLPSPDGTGMISRKHGSLGYSWLAFDWVHGLSFKQAVSCRALVSKAYPQGGGTHAVICCKGDGGAIFEGAVPRLEYEDDFFGKSAVEIRRTMAKKQARVQRRFIVPDLNLPFRD